MRYNLDVPFREKDQAKRYGARWDYERRVWYFESEDPLPDGLKRWYVEPIEPVQEQEEEDQDDPFTQFKTVTEVSAMINDKFMEVEEFHNVLIKGEITECSNRVYGSNRYFSIKDSSSVMSCHIDTISAKGLNFPLENGKKVAIQGYLTLQGRMTRCQLHVRAIYDLGKGDAALALAKLDKELREKGYYDPERKKPIPMYPTKIGIVSSLGGQGCGDMLTKAKEIDPSVQIYLYDTLVQGNRAARQIAAGIAALDKLNLDFLLVGRGGGAEDDLHAFNERLVLDAVYLANTPIISAVGHSRDLTLIDKVADAHVITPTDAVVTYFRDRSKERQNLKRQVDLLHHFYGVCLEKRKEELSKQMSLLKANEPIARLRQKQQLLERLIQSMDFSIHNALDRRVARFKEQLATLNGLSPTAKLVNGFGYITSGTQPVRTVDQVQVNDALEIAISDGTIHAQITDIEKK